LRRVRCWVSEALELAGRELWGLAGRDVALVSTLREGWEFGEVVGDVVVVGVD
jgi:hypothetical protein